MCLFTPTIFYLAFSKLLYKIFILKLSVVSSVVFCISSGNSFHSSKFSVSMIIFYLYTRAFQNKIKKENLANGS